MALDLCRVAKKRKREAKELSPPDGGLECMWRGSPASSPLHRCPAPHVHPSAKHNCRIDGHAKTQSRSQAHGHACSVSHPSLPLLFCSLLFCLPPYRRAVPPPLNSASRYSYFACGHHPRRASTHPRANSPQMLSLRDSPPSPRVSVVSPHADTNTRSLDQVPIVTPSSSLFPLPRSRPSSWASPRRCTPAHRRTREQGRPLTRHESHQHQRHQCHEGDARIRIVSTYVYIYIHTHAYTRGFSICPFPVAPHPHRLVVGSRVSPATPLSPSASPHPPPRSRADTATHGGATHHAQPPKRLAEGGNGLQVHKDQG